MQLFYGSPKDIEKWMGLVAHVRSIFPGLETQAALDEHRATVLHFMEKRQAICVKDGDVMAGVMLFSRGHNMICCLAVAPEYRRRGAASMLMEEALRQLDRAKKSPYQPSGQRMQTAPRPGRSMKNSVSFPMR